MAEIIIALCSVLERKYIVIYYMNFIKSKFFGVHTY